MATKPIIQVAVDDTAFQRFIELFNGYNEKLGDQPAAWDALNEAMAGAGETLKDGAVSGRDALARAASEAERVKTGLSDAAREQAQLNREAAATQRTIQGVGRTASGVSQAVSGAARGSIAEIGAGVAGIAETATAALGPVGIAAAAIAAVVGAAGAASKALADAAVTRQRSAFSKGLTPGQEASFGVYAQQFLGADALQAAASNQTNFASAGALATLGIDFKTARGMTASDLAFRKLQGAVAAAQASPDIPLENIPAIQAYLGLGGNIGDVRNALKLGPAALAAAQADQGRNAGRLDLNRTAVARAAVLKKGVEALGIQAQSGAINTTFGTIPDAIKNPAGAAAAIGTALQHVGQTIVHHVDPALQALKSAASSAARTLEGVAKSFTSPIGGTASAAIVAVAKAKGVDPLLAIATAEQESGLNPSLYYMDHYRDGSNAGYSGGLYGLNQFGEGAGMSLKDILDPKKNAVVALSEVARVMRENPADVLAQFSRAARAANPKLTHAQIMALAGTPGELAAVAQRPADAYGYAVSVNARYQRLVNQMRNTRPPTVHVKVTNPTQSRVSVSINAAALGNQ